MTVRLSARCGRGRPRSHQIAHDPKSTTIRLSSAQLAGACYSFPMRQSFPDWIKPMAATLTQERFTGPEWIFERKFDGIRLLAYRQETSVRLFSRNRLPRICPPVADAVAQTKVHAVVLDGELT